MVIQLKQIWQFLATDGKRELYLYTGIGFLTGLLVFPLSQLIIDDLYELASNLVPEAIGIVFTVFFIDRIYQMREEQQLKKRLLEQVGSQFNMVAISALEGLWANGWWQDDTFKNVQLARADLSGGDLGKANLTGARLADPRYGSVKFDENTILPDETMWDETVDMRKFTDPEHPDYWRGYNLRNQNRRNASYDHANLQGADMRGCNWRHASMRRANLQGARMEGCRLKKTNLTGAQFNEQTILPDGKSWTPHENLARFGAILEDGKQIS